MGSRSDFNEKYGCRKGYIAAHLRQKDDPDYAELDTYEAEFKCIKCKESSEEICDEYSWGPKSTGWCRKVWKYKLESQSCKKSLDFFSANCSTNYSTALADINCDCSEGSSYHNCSMTSCPSAARYLDELFTLSDRQSFFEHRHGEVKEQRRFCHHRGCFFAKSKGRCGYWSIWAAIVVIVCLSFPVLIILIFAIVYLVPALVGSGCWETCCSAICCSWSSSNSDDTERYERGRRGEEEDRGVVIAQVIVVTREGNSRERNKKKGDKKTSDSNVNHLGNKKTSDNNFNNLAPESHCRWCCCCCYCCCKEEDY